MALDQLKKTIRVDERSYEAHALIAIVYERLEKYATAEEYYRRARELVTVESHEYGAVRNNYGAFLCRRGRVEEAVKLFVEAVDGKLYQTPHLALENAGICLLKIGKDDEAAAYFRRALDIQPTLTTSLIELAKYHYKKGDYLLARAFLQRYSENGVMPPDSLMLGIRIEKQLGDKNLLDRYVRELEQKYPDSIEAKQLSELSN
jgi:type IV pilus assembly protein PilF